jgi:hypothetical protein
LGLGDLSDAFITPRSSQAFCHLDSISCGTYELRLGFVSMRFEF